MSTSKSLGAVAGGIAGLAIATLFIIGAFRHTSPPATIIVAAILLSMFLGAGLGAFVGSADR